MGHLQRLPGAAGVLMERTAVSREAGLWKRGLLWLLLLAPLFFASYGVGNLVFAWESRIPLWPWTIVPYWSIDLLYGLSFLLPATRREMDRHGLRLLSVQLLCIAAFLLWPLRFTFERPELDGLFGTLFDVLMGFDKPFNQAPSLHIALLVVLWVCFARYATGLWRVLLQGWFLLIGVSVLTTWQHHFIDVPTGVLAGWLCVWLWPHQGPSPLLHWQPARDPQRWRLALRYGLGAALMAVYLGAAGLSSRLWTRKHPHADEVGEGVWLGRIPAAGQAERFHALLDLCAELPRRASAKAYHSLPVLDLSVPNAHTLLAAAQAIETLRQQGPLLVYCALGYSRSATAVAAWLLHSGRCQNLNEALARLRRARPQVVLREAHQRALTDMQQLSAGATPALATAHGY